MIGQRIGGRICCTQYLYIETLKQRAWPELGGFQFCFDLVIDTLRRLSSQFFFDPKNATELVGQPSTGRCPPKEVKVIGKDLPDLAVILFNRSPIHTWNTQ